jgi:hypothetical protein
MSDSWCYVHETAICGPVSRDELRRLIQTGGLYPTDMIWPAGEDRAVAVPAAALAWIAQSTHPVSAAPAQRAGPLA